MATLLALLFLLWLNGEAATNAGCRVKVIDAVSGRPIHGAMVTLGDSIVATDEEGRFTASAAGGRFGIRAYGYQRKSVNLGPAQRREQELPLVPITPRGVYLSVYGVSEPLLRDPVLKLLDTTVLNSVVIDVKGDRGIIPYNSAIKMVQESGANASNLAPELPALVAKLHDKGIYTIARIVVFKDDVLARAHPELALKDSGDNLWLDREGLAWTQPYNREVWAYNIAVAAEAAQMGFDEIQFDYMRFPDEQGPHYAMENTESNRVETVVGFLKLARQQMQAYNVFISADLFGYVLWNNNDTYIGQRLEELVPLLDYLSPMLYPSSFQYGIPGIALPTEDPYAIVYHSLQRGVARTGLPALRFRPWLQGFCDYAFDGEDFTDLEVQSQINAAEMVGTHGWMLWNPRNVYAPELFNEGCGMMRAESALFE